jgi:hypothetical protein
MGTDGLFDNGGWWFERHGIPARDLKRLAHRIPEGPHFRHCHDLDLAAFAHAGAEIDVGGKLFAKFLAAGLPTPQMVAWPP